MFFFYKQQYKTNNEFQINNIILIIRNQMNDNITNYNFNYINFKIQKKLRPFNKINRFKHVRKHYLSKYYYMNININQLQIKSTF